MRHFCIVEFRPTVCVTHWWVGRDNVALPESTPSHERCLKTRRLPPPWLRRTLPEIGCTVCWHASQVSVCCLQKSCVGNTYADRYTRFLWEFKASSMNNRFHFSNNGNMIP